MYPPQTNQPRKIIAFLIGNSSETLYKAVPFKNITQLPPDWVNAGNISLLRVVTTRGGRLF